MTTPPALQAGQVVTVMNRITRQTAPLRVIEMGEYKGLAIVYGETGRHGIRVQPGVREVPPRESVFVFVPEGNALEIERFCEDIGGWRLGLVFTQNLSLINVGQTAVNEEERYYPIINGPLPSWFGPEIKMDYRTGSGRPAAEQKDRLMKLGLSTVDCWLKWQANKGMLSPSEILQRDIWKTRSN